MKILELTKEPYNTVSPKFVLVLLYASTEAGNPYRFNQEKGECENSSETNFRTVFCM